MTDWSQLHTDFLAHRRGDKAATRRAFEPLLTTLRAYFRMRTGSLQDADDLAQVALLKIHVGRDRYDAGRSLKTWVFAVASRCLIDHWRTGRAARAADAFDDEVEQTPAGGLPHDLRLELNDALSAALATLKPLDRTIVYLYGVEQLTMAEIAAAVGVTEGAAKLRAHRSYVQLRALLGFTE